MTAKQKNVVKHTLICWTMGGLPVLGFVLFMFLPIVISLWLGFTELHVFELDKAKWVGFENYKKVLSDPMFYKAIVNTLYSLISVPISMLLGLLLAVLLSKESLKGKGLFKAMFFLPFVCSSVVVTTTFMWLFDVSEFGIINSILHSLGFNTVSFLTTPSLIMPIATVMIVWNGMGQYMLIFQAALTNINKEVIEAASIDGAGACSRFFKIILPLISPTAFYLLNTGLISGLQNFVMFQVLASAASGTLYGPSDACITLVFYLYQSAFTNVYVNGPGFAAAIAWIVTIIIMVATWLNFKLSKKWVNYD